MKYDVYLVCPVRVATEIQKSFLMGYVNGLESQGYKVYYPARDTDQNDDTGSRICNDNKNAILNSKEIHILWDEKSIGSIFDLGIAFAYEMPLKIINIEDVNLTNKKSFTNMIYDWHNLSKLEISIPS